MNLESFSIKLNKQKFSFNGTLVTLNSHDHLEILGSIYQIAVCLKCIFQKKENSPILHHGMMVDFREIKPVIKEICENLEKKIFIPRLDSNIQKIEQKDMLVLQYKTDILTFPINNCVFIECQRIENIHFLELIAQQLFQKIGKTFFQEKSTFFYQDIQKMKISLQNTSGINTQAQYKFI